VQLICFLIPGRGPQESQIVLQLVEDLEGIGISNDYESWGALAVMVGKPHQKHRHWLEYI